MALCYVLLNVEPGMEEKVLSEVRKVPNVKDCHRVYGVYDMIAKVESGSMDSLKEIVTKAKAKVPEGMTVEVEVTTPEDGVEAAEAGADIIMFDNMTTDEMRRTVGMLPEVVKTEASGGINLSNVRATALTGVDIISVGALTHSAKVLDISLELEA